MGLLFKKSKKILPGVRMTVTNKGVSISAGTKHARVSASTSGRKSASLNLGKGLTFRKSKGGKRK